VQVSVPEISGQHEGLAGVSVEVDDERLGTTDEHGRAELSVRAGARRVRLRHSCFGPDGRELSEVMVQEGQPNQLEVLSDIRLYIYASEPEPDDVADGPADGREPGEAPTFEPTLVWVSASLEQIPEGAVGLDGTVKGLGLAGTETEAKLCQDRPTEFVLSSGAAVSQGQEIKCGDVTSLCVSASRAGFKWRPKDPSPLAERAQELGGSEYLRLMECPVVLGFLEPTFRVCYGSGSVLDLSVMSHITVGDVKATMVEELNAAVESLWVFHEGKRLEDGVFMRPSMDVKIVEVAPLAIRVLSGCCGEPLLAKVLLDGNEVGMTNASGELQWDVPLGSHKVAIKHHALGTYPREPKEIVVSGGGQVNEVIMPALPRVYVYATDPDVEEAEAPPGEDEEPLFDPSCVWVAVDPEQIPDDALPLQGHARCACPTSGRKFRAELHASKVVPFRLPFDEVAQPTTPRVCPLAAVRVRCGRRGFKWVPKDPTPLQARAEDLGGCELLRLLECPTAFGFLKQAATVQCASGERIVVALDGCSDLPSFRAHLAEALGVEEGAAALELVDAAGLAPVTGPYIRSSADLLCARPGESLAVAKEKLQQWRKSVEAKGGWDVQGDGYADSETDESGTEQLPLDEESALVKS